MSILLLGGDFEYRVRQSPFPVQAGTSQKMHHMNNVHKLSGHSLKGFHTSCRVPWSLWVTAHPKMPGHTMEPMPSFHPMITVMVSSSCVTSSRISWRFYRICFRCYGVLWLFRGVFCWCTYNSESSKMIRDFSWKPNATFPYRKIRISWRFHILRPTMSKHNIRIMQHHYKSTLCKNVGANSDTVAQYASCHSHSTTVFENAVWSSWVSLKPGLFFGTACHEGWRRRTMWWWWRLGKHFRAIQQYFLVRTRKRRERGA